MTDPTDITTFAEARFKEVEALAGEARDPLYVNAYEAKVARQLVAEVAKDRALLALHRPYQPLAFDDPGLLNCNECDSEYPCQTVRLLGAVHGGHPDYDPEWKPEAS